MNAIQKEEMRARRVYGDNDTQREGETWKAISQATGGIRKVYEMGGSKFYVEGATTTRLRSNGTRESKYGYREGEDPKIVKGMFGRTWTAGPGRALSAATATVPVGIKLQGKN